jgi:SAM-dependent methyltransferase
MGKAASGANSRCSAIAAGRSTRRRRKPAVSTVRGYRRDLYVGRVPTARQKLRKTVSRVVPVPPRATWDYALPGLAAVHEARWKGFLKRLPVITADEHAERTGVEDIEEVIGCSLCGERRMKPLWEARAAGDGDWRYDVVMCASCSFMYRHPGIKPERLGELYGGGKYSKFLLGDYEKNRRRRYGLVLDAFGPLFADGAGRRLFDYGCGAGHFLEVTHERGFDGYGVDLSPDSIAQARERPGGQNTYFGTPHEVPEIAAGGFDVVTLMSVLAHLPEPVQDFTMLRGLLNPDGVLLVLTVNANSVKLKANRSRWNGFTRNHLKFFSPTTLPILLREAGFAAVVFRPMYGDNVEAGKSSLTPRQQARLRRTIDQGNRGNMMRAVAFNDPDGPARWGLADGAIKL